MIIETGKLIAVRATFDENGAQLTPDTFHEGWHIDAAYRVPELEEYLISPQPDTPAHAIAGAEKTWYYRFESRQQWLDISAAGISPPPPAPPRRVTMRQARLALAQAGLLTAVESAIAALDEPHKTRALIEWQYAHEISMSWDIVQMVTAQLGMTEQEINQLFVLAASL